MNCVSCNYANNVGAKFCMECGSPLKIRCKQCGTTHETPTKFCMECGQPFNQASVNSNTTKITNQTANAERRQLTVMFCSIMDVMKVSNSLGPEAFSRILLWYQQETKKICDKHNAYIAQYMDNGFLIYFGYPKGLEDAAGAAIRAAIAIKTIFINKLPDDLENKPISWRFGIHTGQVVVDYHLALGDTTNIAARIESLAKPNSILISQETEKLSKGWFETISQGFHKLKGIENKMELFEVKQIRETKNNFELSVAKGLSPLIDREEEFLMLKRNWTNACNGKGNIILLEGEAGIGKSRLVESVKNEILISHPTSLIEVSCSYYHQNTSFYPIINLLESNLLHFEEGDSIEQKQRKLKMFIENSDLGEASISSFSELLSLPVNDKINGGILTSAQKKKKIRSIILQALINKSNREPVLLVVEDIHWADHSTLEWIEMFVAQLPTHPIFTLATARPEFQSNWLSKSHALKLKLRRLSLERIEDICNFQSNGKSLPLEIMEQIRERTDGIPLFVEELTRMVLDSNMLIEKEDRYELNGPLQILAIPSTLQDSLITRLDNLDIIKELAQIGAVLGRSFSFNLIKLVSGRPEETLIKELNQLIASDILLQRGFLPEASYIFKHALICDTAYNSLLKSRRALLHQRVAQVLEAHFKHLCQAQPELLAHHLTEANQVEKAINCWQAAGELSIKKHALIEGVHHLKKGLALLPKLTSAKITTYELKLLKLITPNLQLSRGYANEEVEVMADRWLQVAKETKDVDNIYDALVGQFTYYTFSANYQKGTAASTDLLELAKQKTDAYFSAVALFFNGIQNTLAGKYVIAQRQFEDVLKIYKPELHIDRNYYNIGNIKSTTLTYSSTTLHLLGYPEQAMKNVIEAQSIAFEVNQNGSIYSSTAFRSRLHLARGEYSKIESIIGPALQVAIDNDDTFIIGLLSFYKCLGLALQGQVEALEKAYYIVNKLFKVYKSFRIAFLVYIAEAWLKLENIEKGLAIINEAFKHVFETGEQMYLPALYILKGDLLFLENSKNKEIESIYLKAIQISESQSDKWHYLLSAISLSKYWIDKNKDLKAYDVLLNAYNSFPEKSNIKCIRETEAMLNSLNPSWHEL